MVGKKSPQASVGHHDLVAVRRPPASRLRGWSPARPPSRFCSAEQRNAFSRAMAIADIVLHHRRGLEQSRRSRPRRLGASVVSSSPRAMRSAYRGRRPQGPHDPAAGSKALMPGRQQQPQQGHGDHWYVWKLAILLTVWRRLTKLWSVISSVRMSNLSSMAPSSCSSRGAGRRGPAPPASVLPAARSRQSAGARRPLWRAAPQPPSPSAKVEVTSLISAAMAARPSAPAPARTAAPGPASVKSVWAARA